MTEFQSLEIGRKMVSSPDMGAGGSISDEEKNKAENFRPSFLFGSEEEMKKSGIDGNTKYGRTVRMFHVTADNLSLESLQDSAYNLFILATEEDVGDATHAYVQGKIGERILKLKDEDPKRQPKNTEAGEKLLAALDKQYEVQNKILEKETNMEAMQYVNIELLRKSGFSGFVSAMDARAGINVQQFDTEAPVWYDNLSSKWKWIIRTNLGILLGSYYKLKSPVKGAELIISAEDIQIQREALAGMWEFMPGFRIAVATIVHDLFDQNSTDCFKLTKEGAKILNNLPAYKEELISKLNGILEKDPLLDQKNNGGGPDGLSSGVAARFAVSSAINLFYLGGAFESGDESSSYLPKSKNTGKNLKDSQAYNPSVRTFYLPRDQAYSKYFIGEKDITGTDEGWGGGLGDWFAERIRHSERFRDDYMNNRGITTLIPKRLMYSLFELTTFNNGKTMTDEFLTGGDGKSEVVDDEKNPTGLYDYIDPNKINLRDLKYSEIWGGYADTMDSAWKVYQAIIGNADTREFTRQKLGNALSKLKKNEKVRQIYTGKSGEDILTAAVISLTGGPSLYVSEVLLKNVGDAYDFAVHGWLDDDRILAGLPSGARKRMFNILNAVDKSSLTGEIRSYFIDGFMGKRGSLRRKAEAAWKRLSRKI